MVVHIGLVLKIVTFCHKDGVICISVICYILNNFGLSPGHFECFAYKVLDFLIFLQRVLIVLF